MIRPRHNEKYLYYKPKIKNRFLHIIGAGIVYSDKDYGFNKIRDCYLFEYIIKGKGYIQSGDISATVCEGDSIIYSASKKIKYGADKKDPYTKIWFSANGSFVDTLFEEFCKNNNDYFVINKTNTFPLIEKVISLLDNAEDNLNELTHIILDLILLTCGLSENTKSNYFNPNSTACLIKSIIDSNLQQDINLAKIADYLNISEYTAVKRFKAEYGISPAKYILNQRIITACELLENTEKSVTEIALTLKFCEQSYFSTVFKDTVGLTPSEYRISKRTKNR